MSAIIIVSSFIAALTLLPMIIGFMIWKKSFVHKCWVAIQTGPDPSDVIWKEDRFKVVNKKGFHKIVFKSLKGSAPAPDGSFWTKLFSTNDLEVDVGDWDKKNLSNQIQRGLYLYRSIDGQFNPMSLQREDKKGTNFKILTQDNRNFVLETDRDVHELTMSARKQMWTIVAVIIAIAALGFCFIMFLIYMGESIDKFCAVAPAANQGIIQGVQTAVGG